MALCLEAVDKMAHQKIHLRPKVLKTRKSNSLFNTSRGNYKPKRK